MMRVKSFLVAAALILSVALPFFFAAAALATRFGVIDWRLGFATVTLQIGPLLLVGAAALALVALLAAVFVKPRQGIASALIALVIPLAAIGYGAYVRSSAGALPPIHDIVSDAAAPLAFSQQVLAARAAQGANPVEADPRVPEDARFAAASGRRARDLQREAYPDIGPIIVSRAPAAAFESALAIARSQGWIVDSAEPAEGRIEARVRSFWFGFTDDVVVQISPAPEGSRIDMRSTSRVGVSDLGANAARLRRFRQALET